MNYVRRLVMPKPELRPCVACGEDVPEKQLYPYTGHCQSCPLAKTWRAVGEQAEGRIPHGKA